MIERSHTPSARAIIAQMSKREDPMIEWYWRQVGGTLIKEFPAYLKTPTCGRRLLDAVILTNKERRRAKCTDVSLKGEDVIVVQAKANRLGMYLMGQTLFSAELIKRFEPASIRSVALCHFDDSVLRPLLESYGMEVVIVPRHVEPSQT